jgi:peptidyl-prolyl cis-trans isomerase C
VRPALAAAACVAAGALLVVHGETRADDAAAPSGWRAAVVAVVGASPASRSIPAGELEDRIDAMPAFQRASLGATPDAIRHAVLDQVLVRDALLSLGAESGGIDAKPAVQRAVDRALANATVRALRDSLGPPAAIPMADVEAYYDRNRVRYDAPARYRIARILCKTRDEAASVLAAAQADATPKTFGQLAREHSQDKATALRGGDLGFLTAAGESNEPGLRVDPAVVQAAQGVRDGEFVRAPVVEGEFFSVVWRRGSTVAQKRKVEDVAGAIREIVAREKLKDETDRLVASLRASKVRDLHEDLLDGVEIPVEAGVLR